jgi:hypothetical protein
MRKKSRQRSIPASLPAPVGGWNSRDSLGEMKATDAVYLKNWFPATTDVVVRNGYTNFATGMSGQVESLMAYSGGASNKFFAAVGSNIYEVTAGGAVGAAVVANMTNARWQYVNISTAGGNFLIAFNGADNGLRYNGTTWVAVTSITGKTVSSLTGNGTTSTVTTSTNHGLLTGNTITVTGAVNAAVSISTLTGNGTTSTVTTTANHGLNTGDTITVTGASVGGFNVTNKAVTVTGATTFTYLSTGTPSATGASYTVLVGGKFNVSSVTVTRTGATTFTYPSSGEPSATGATYTVGEGISGVDPATIIGVNLFKNRLWLTQKDTLNAWYLPTSSIAGAASQFPILSVARSGGYIMSIGTWTADGGYGMDDMLAIVTNKGEVVVYNGLDPAEASSWQLTGVWQLGSPIGRRCLLKYSGDLLLICQDGLVPLSSALQSSRVNPTVALSNKIMSAVAGSVSTYGSTFGWDLVHYAKANMLILNVPVAVGTQEQYVMNTITKSWCNFTGWAANCWAVFNDEIYFGGNGIVGRAWNGTNDAGTNIVADGKQAFNYFGTAGTLKRWTMMRPTISTNGSPGVLASLNVDFDDTAPTSPVSYSSVSSATWDSGLWDTALWGGGNSIQHQWQGVTGVGYCAAPRLKVVSQGIDVHWISTDLVMEGGAIL